MFHIFDSENFDESIKSKFVDECKKFTDRVIIHPVMGWTRSEVYDWRNGIKRKENGELKVCPDPFSRFTVNFDGTVSVWYPDWSHGTLVGDLNNETFSDVAECRLKSLECYIFREKDQKLALVKIVITLKIKNLLKILMVFVTN